MAINPNNSLKARHISYCGASGAGKTVAVKCLSLVGDCAALFDPYGDYKLSRLKKLSGLGNGRIVHHYHTRRGFIKAFTEAWASGKKFAVAYQPQIAEDKLRAEAIWFAQVVWAAADGKRELHAVFEELGRYVESSGAERSKIGEIVTGGRKFGLIGHYVFQRPSEVPKTILGNCAEYVVGAQQAMIDVRRWVDELDCSIDEIASLDRLNTDRHKHFLHKKGGIRNYKLIEIRF
ncbi:hypothetical protein [Shewanella baltica]|uniref:hypothetical protein n=1 Tax=Shewanella baltica TaxID=62322 RepID=UPI00217E5C47|nr:hypothetical protein [Shewanella baltica]MCS6211262.1 hypothetical protein [Shewanella baltica]